MNSTVQTRMHSLYSSRQSSNRRTAHETQDVADTGIAETVLPAPLQSFPTSRGQLTLNQNNPQAPLPQSTFSNDENTKDDISLPQLRQIVAEIPKIEVIPYAFTYTDTASFEDEINEWFSYSEAEYKRLIHAKDIFQARWKKFGSKPWTLSDISVCEKFVKKEVYELQTSSSNRRWKSLQTILHVILGVWDATACIDSNSNPRISQAKASSRQISQMKFGLDLVVRAGGIPILFNILQSVFQIRKSLSFQDSAFSTEKFPYIQNELNTITSIFYLIIEQIRYDSTGLISARKELFKSSPNLVSYLIDVTASLRWDEASILPQKKVFLLLWKSILLSLGGTAELNNVKKETNEDQNSGDEFEKLITASPLDYHIFRQEIISKYPAYTPPQPLIPLEPENNSILPPLFNRPQIANRTNAGIINSTIDVNSSGASILHQPVHIATPAPSPPPSPPVGGKAGKKQNYQTNQNFPFIYPPLDSSSNSAGGKGLAGLQELIVGRKWKGSDIPKSILEAGDLFSKRMRMSRSMRQLWDEREKFIKSERGWDDEEDPFDFGDSDPETAMKNRISNLLSKPDKPNVDRGPNNSFSDDSEQKLGLVEDIYKKSLPHLQSLVIVLLRAMQENIKLIGQYEEQSQGSKDANPRRNTSHGQQRVQEPVNASLPYAWSSNIQNEELAAPRTREIISKAVSAIILLLLKWFKISHILKFEYFTQLLLDSNYLALTLKSIAHQEIENIVNIITDHDEKSFFAFCNSNSDYPSFDGEQTTNFMPEDNIDDAVPPPIKLRRDTIAPFETENGMPSYSSQEEYSTGTNPILATDDVSHSNNVSADKMIYEFSWRNFFSLINLLRIMQKVCKNKTHRNLLLVQYKSSSILKKVLKISQPSLRLYTLKLFKNQVPYCGRRWRQGNMRVITAVYLHCRPELRDDWLAGGNISTDVDEALPLEQALRALTHWHNVKRYPSQMGINPSIIPKEHDFFLNELEKMEVQDESAYDGEGIVDSGWEYVGNGGW